jgi:hypothetical protein
MKHIAFLAALMMSCAAFAQAPKPEPIKAEPIKAEPAKAEPAKPKAAKAAAKQSSRRSEDARQCLERPTNNEIIKCAEEYL